MMLLFETASSQIKSHQSKAKGSIYFDFQDDDSIAPPAADIILFSLLLCFCCRSFIPISILSVFYSIYFLRVGGWGGGSVAVPLIGLACKLMWFFNGFTNFMFYRKPFLKTKIKEQTNIFTYIVEFWNYKSFICLGKGFSVLGTQVHWIPHYLPSSLNLKHWGFWSFQREIGFSTGRVCGIRSDQFQLPVPAACSTTSSPQQEHLPHLFSQHA